jgi:hypothetical protein
VINPDTFHGSLRRFKIESGLCLPGTRAAGGVQAEIDASASDTVSPIDSTQITVLGFNTFPLAPYSVFRDLNVSWVLLAARYGPPSLTSKFFQPTSQKSVG